MDRSRRWHPLVPLLTAVLVTLALAVAAPAARADRQVVRDPARDAVAFDPATGERLPRPGNRTADVTRASASYDDGRLVLRVRVRQLERRPFLQQAYFRVVTRRAVFEVAFVQNRWAGKTFGITRDEEELRCDGLTGSADPRTDRVRITVPRRCLGNARWVRWGAWFQTFTLTTEVKDDARARGLVERTPLLGRRLHHG
jgi:hypothetical protein